MLRLLALFISVLLATSAVSSAADSDHAETPIDSELQNAIEPLLRSHQGDIGLAVHSLNSGIHYEYNADAVMPTASLIKLPMLVAAYQLVDEGKLAPSEKVPLQETDKAPGSGVLREHFTSGIELPMRDYLRLMVRYSDNTATNIVADQIGLTTTATAMEKLGLGETKLHSKVYRGDTSIFPDRSRMYGLGSTTANEMVRLLKGLERGELASKSSTAAMKEHLLQCDDESKLAAKLPSNVKFAHKTGAIANCRTDAGILYTAAGPVVVCFLSNKNKDQSWSDENEANLLAARIGELIVKRFGHPDPDRRLREGAFGELVESLQRTLNKRLDPPPNLAVDGDFGPATRGAVERFQRTNKLKETGIVDSATWKALGKLIEEGPPVPDPNTINSQHLPRTPQPEIASGPIVTCKAWAIADADGSILFESNASAQLEAASTTKIMTAFVVLQYAHEHPEVLDELVQFSSQADNTVGSTAGIRAGEQVSVRHLLYGLLLPSGNDASVALAEHFGPHLASYANDHHSEENSASSYQQFINAMNQTAKSLGMEQTNYTNPHGLSNEAHVTSARDLVRVTRKAMQFELFRKICGTRQFGCTLHSEKGYQRNVLWKNTNKLLEIEGYSGVKTGTTSAAGACLVAVGERGGDELLVVVLGSSSSPARYSDIRNLFRWAWQERSANNATN